MPVFDADLRWREADHGAPGGVPALERRWGIARERIAGNVGSETWWVEVDGSRYRATVFPGLTGTPATGDRVLLNTTAVSLGLGTGGKHIVMAVELDPAMPPTPFPGREAGHLIKLRYTPAQHRVLAVEEPASPFRRQMDGNPGLDGAPVLAAELHSQAAAAILAARAVRPTLRIALVVLDSAALPVADSRLLTRLRRDATLNAVISTGQAFGGDLETVNVYTGLLAARLAAGADLIVVSQGPGNAGTGTRLGFSGMALVEALHAADFLEGLCLLLPRISDADPRPRHRGVSHHTLTLLRALRVSVTVPLPAGFAWPDSDPDSPGTGSPRRLLPVGVDHRYLEADAEPGWAALRAYENDLTTMGRTLDEDPLFFRASAAAGILAASSALSS